MKASNTRRSSPKTQPLVAFWCQRVPRLSCCSSEELPAATGCCNWCGGAGRQDHAGAWNLAERDSHGCRRLSHHPEESHFDARADCGRCRLNCPFQRAWSAYARASWRDMSPIPAPGGAPDDAPPVNARPAASSADRPGREQRGCQLV